MWPPLLLYLKVPVHASLRNALEVGPLEVGPSLDSVFLSKEISLSNSDLSTS